MTHLRIASQGQADKLVSLIGGEHQDFLRELLRQALQEVMEAEVRQRSCAPKLRCLSGSGPYS